MSVLSPPDLLEKLVASYAKRVSKMVRSDPVVPNSDLLAELYQARLAHRLAKAAYTDKAMDLGEPCRGYVEYSTCYYNIGLSRAEWCDRCDTLQPLWEAKQATGARAGAALRACTTRGRQILERRTS